MKKLKKILRQLRLEREGLFQILAYGITIVWYGYVLRLIGVADISLFPKILLFIGGLVLGFFTCISLHNAFSEDDE